MECEWPGLDPRDPAILVSPNRSRYCKLLAQRRFPAYPHPHSAGV